VVRERSIVRAGGSLPFVAERDLCWASLGQNVGSEVNGKSDRFSRPVLIMRKLAHRFYLVAPTTTREREGTLTRKVKRAIFDNRTREEILSGGWIGWLWSGSEAYRS
jgi:hypothetical protein